VVHCGKTNARVPETMAKIEVSEFFPTLSPRWHDFKDGLYYLYWFMALCPKIPLWIKVD
jgi:hypothetical protein